MKERLNRETCQERYSRGIQIIEPVFADISCCKGLNRFALRGKEKANGQWRLYCIAHNLGKCLKGHDKKKEFARRREKEEKK
ncbi:MAG: transposase [Treponema sp.]|nr:transposase [Treponema sp.]